jgi:hypothetical protein
MTFEEYHAQYGYERDQPGWDTLSDEDKDAIKDKVPLYQGPGETEQGLAEDWLADLEGGPDTNIWQGLSKTFGFSPGAIKKFVMGKFGELMQTPDFAKEYGLSRKALDQQLMEAERGIAGKFAARGLLDSSAHAQAVGGAMGGYTQGLAGLMLGKAGMEESARSDRFNQGMGMASQGLNFADFLNTQFLQKMGLGAEAINYLQQNRAQENAFNMQRYAINPNPNDPITTMEGIGMGANIGAGIYSAIAGGGGYNFDWTGGGGGGPANTGIPTLQEDLFGEGGIFS